MDINSPVENLTEQESENFYLNLLEVSSALLSDQRINLARAEESNSKEELLPIEILSLQTNPEYLKTVKFVRDCFANYGIQDPFVEGKRSVLIEEEVAERLKKIDPKLFDFLLCIDNFVATNILLQICTFVNKKPEFTEDNPFLGTTELACIFREHCKKVNDDVLIMELLKILRKCIYSGCMREICEEE